MAVIQTYVSDALKADAERTFAQMGMTVGEGVRMFLHASIAQCALPFKPRVQKQPTEKLLKAMKEMDDYRAGKPVEGIMRFDSAEAALAFLNEESKE